MNLAQMIPLAESWGMHDGDVGAGWMIVMGLFWAAVVLAVVWLIRGSARGWSAPTESPLETLERRFAEGTISLEDYRSRRDVLVNGTAAANGAHETPVMAPGKETAR